MLEKKQFTNIRNNGLRKINKKMRIF